jgi:arginase
MNKIAVIGVPSSAGARRTGQERAPERLRNADLFTKLRKTGMEVADLGDLPLIRYSSDREHPNQQNVFLVAALVRQLAARVNQAIAVGYKPLILGGDCTITIGAVSGCLERYPNLGLLYMDADIDRNLPEDSPSGILDGMVLSHMIGEGNSELSHAGVRYPLLKEEDIVVFGYNEASGFIDAGELQRFESSNMNRFPVRQIEGKGAEVASSAIEVLRKRNNAFLLHFDVDVLDESEFPAADVPHRFGMSLEDAEGALRVFLRSPDCIAFVITELNAERDPDGFWSRMIVDLVANSIAV